jgi:protein involved in polysaccharide export with SLBB domain
VRAGSYEMRTFASRITIITTLCCGLLGLNCGPRADNTKVRLAVPEENETVGPGDVFSLRVLGERELSDDYEIADDGTVDLPYVHRIKVEGLNPKELADFIREKFKEAKILTDANLIVRIKEYNSRAISVLGAVRKPGKYRYVNGLTFVELITMTGGFNAISNKGQIQLIRTTKNGIQNVMIDGDAIIEGSSPDIPLQAGDRIYVHERIF